MARSRHAFRRRLRNILEGAGAYFLVGILKLLPVRAASALGGWLGRTIGRRSKVTERAYRNLERVFPDMPRSEVDDIVRGMWDNLGRTACEYPHLKPLGAPHILERIAALGFGEVMRAAERGEPLVLRSGRIEVVGIEHAIDFYFKPGPRIIFSGHFGNWEIMPLVASNLGMPVEVVFRRPNNPYVDRLLAKMRSGHGHLVPKGILGAVLTRRTLDRGGLLGMLVDQKHNQGIAVPFFGRPAMTAPMVARLALRYRCPMHGAWIQRLSGLRFRVTITPALDLPDTGDDDADARTVMTRVNEIVEGWIRERPDQWMWVHRRWPAER